MPPTAVPAPGAQDMHQADGDHAEAAGEHHDESIGGMIKGMGWPVANFIIFVGVIYYFVNQPFSDYLAGRSATIRKDLVEAAELKATATAQLADHRTEAAGAARRAEHAAHPRRRGHQGRRGSASPRPRPPIANGCSSRRAARSICRCGSRRKKFSSTRPTSRCSSRPSASRRKSRRKIRRAWSIVISIK